MGVRGVKSARSHAAGGAKRGGKTSVARLRAAAERVLSSSVADLHEALAELREALGAEKNATAGYAPEPYDWYVEQGWCSDLFFQAESFVGEIVDPACGMGTIVMRAIAAGYIASGTDLIHRQQLGDYPFDTFDFLGERWSTAEVDNIVCNPPYSYETGIAERFIRRALDVTRRKVAMLLPTKFNSSNGRHALFTGTPLVRIHTLCSRPSMPPGSLLTTGKIKPKGGKVDYAWFVWERGHVGAPTNHYLILPEKLDAQRRRAQSKEAA